MVKVKMEETDQQVFNVIGIPEPYIGDDSEVRNITILGTFTDLTSALIFMEAQKDLNTTMIDVTIVSSPLMEQAPDMDMFVLVYVEQGLVSVRSVPLSPDTEPMLRDDKEFEALGEFNDKDKLVKLAVQWHNARYGSQPEIDDYVSPAITDYF